MSSRVPSPRKVILSSIEQLDKEMTQHSDNCFKCSEHGPCVVWVEMVETWNFYFAAYTRAMRNKYIELPDNYEKDY